MKKMQAKVYGKDVLGAICDRISENEPYCTYNNYATAADK